MHTISVETNHFPKYSQSELNQLIEKAQHGCLVSREKVVESNLKLVLKILHRFKGREKEFEDLFQMGVIGLIKCIDNFEVERELKFSTYAFPMILGEMKRYLRDQTGTIKVSRTIKENNQKILKIKEKLIQKNHREPTVKEVALELDISEEDVLLAMDAHLEIYSFSQPIEHGDSKDISLEEKLADEKNPFDNWLIKNEIKEGLKKLSETEKTVVERRYFQNKIQQEVAEELSISQAQVSRIERKSLKKLRGII